MSTLRPVRTPEAFVAAAKTAPRADELNARVIKQINIRMPETEHADLLAVVDSLPRMSMQRFIVEAIAEKVARLKQF